MTKIPPAAPPGYEERLLSTRELGARWSDHPKVAYKRAIKLGAKPVRFNARTIKFRLSEIIRIETEATVGFDPNEEFSETDEPTTEPTRMASRVPPPRRAPKNSV
jgi:hypothetical protein